MSSADHIAEKTVALDLEHNMKKQLELVDSLEKQLHDLRYGDVLPEPRNVIQRYLMRIYDRKYPEWRSDEKRIREVFGDEVAEQFAERRRMEAEVEQRLAREAALLGSATKNFHDAYRKYARKMIQVHRLRLHIKKNIIYYMQSIWDHEIPDERIMRLQNTLVPKIKGKRHYSLKNSGKSRRAFTWESPLEYNLSFEATECGDDYQKLIEIADLGNMLGYMGNYMIFPLIESNDITTFMMAPYIDERSSVKDPDDFGNYTLNDLDKYVCCLKKSMDPVEFENMKPFIDEIYEARLTDPRPDEEEIVVPMESLFIEILPGSYPILENFKLEHRAVDVHKAVAGVVKQQLENLRFTGRLIKEEFGDPEVDKRVVVNGDTETVISVDEEGDE